MAAPCTEHLFLTGEKGVGKSTLARHLLAGTIGGGAVEVKSIRLS